MATKLTLGLIQTCFPNLSQEFPMNSDLMSESLYPSSVIHPKTNLTCVCYNHHNFSNSQIIWCNNLLVIDRHKKINNPSNLGMFRTYTSLVVRHCMFHISCCTYYWKLPTAICADIAGVFSLVHTCALNLLQLWCLDSPSVHLHICNAFDVFRSSH